jgi:hypothetical protein
MSGTLEMLQAQPHPMEPELRERVAAFVDCAFACAQACTSCASSCLAEPDPKPLVDCINVCLDTAALCTTAARILSRSLSDTRRLALAALVEACAGMCEMSARECFQHEVHRRYCELCKITCRACLDACERLLEVL